MARILYLHGSQAGPFGPKTEYLERHGHQVVSRQLLPYHAARGGRADILIVAPLYQLAKLAKQGNNDRRAGLCIRGKNLGSDRPGHI
jgi:hypothetical protein